MNIEKCQISNFMKIHPLIAKLFYVEGQSDMTELMVTFLNFVMPLKRL